MAEELLRTLERAVEVLKAFGREEPNLNIGRLVERLAMPRSVVVRILATLERAGFIERLPDNPRLFRVGLAACEVGALYLVGNPLLRSAEDVLRDLAERTGFTSYLGTLYGADVVILALREGRTPIRFIWQAGERLPVATTALGKALLMHMSSAQLDALLGTGPLPGLTDGSIRTRGELDAQLAHYRGGGWIPAFEESFPGVFAVGAAVLDPAGSPAAGVSLSLLRTSVAPDEIGTIGDLVLQAAGSIARRLGPRIAYGRAALGPNAPAGRTAGTVTVVRRRPGRLKTVFSHTQEPTP
jgi:DNA-binding IclR family transcriptional regulator